LVITSQCAEEPYTAAALILLGVSLIAAYFVRKLERRLAPEVLTPSAR
jgi:hypothetical protein